jgi:hypothetical protein
MLILIGVALAIGILVLTVLASGGCRSGLGDLGSVSTQWLSEHRDYQDGSRSR